MVGVTVGDGNSVGVDVGTMVGGSGVEVGAAVGLGDGAVVGDDVGKGAGVTVDDNSGVPVGTSEGA